MIDGWPLVGEEPPDGRWTPERPRRGLAWSLRHSRRRPFVALRVALVYLVLGLSVTVAAFGIARLLA